MKNLFLLIVCCSSVYSQTVFQSKKSIMSLAPMQILDVRDFYSFQQQRVEGSIHVDVNKLNDVKSIKSSLLLAKQFLQKSLQLQGVKTYPNYLVLGLGVHKWGEDGRLFWLLDNFTSSNVYLYDGGYKQYAKDFSNQITQVKSRFEKGSIILDKTWSPLSFAQVNTHGGSIIDVRTTAEFLGATPFGSAKGGRIKNAISIPWSDFFTPDGFINHRNKSSILSRLNQDTNALVYCTAGYRSALVYAVLKHWGVSSDNYDGSWFEYSMRSDL